MASAISQHRRFLVIGSTIAVLLAVGGFFTFHALTVKASGNTLYVGTGSGDNSSCSSAGYTSVQAAVDAAVNGQTIYLCGSQAYTGPVVISNKHVTLTGDAGAGISAPASFTPVDASRLPPAFATDSLFSPQVVLMVWGADADVTVSGLRISGVMATNGGCANQDFGVLVVDNGNVTLNQDQVLDIHDSNAALYGCQFGEGIQIGRTYWPTANFSNFDTENFVGHARINDTLVQGYQKNGITIDGIGSTADIDDNTINGAGRDTQFAPIIAQNGIQISRGATGSVTGNHVSGNSYTGTAWASSGGIITFGGCGDALVTNVDIADNVVTDNDIGIYLNNYSADCAGPATTPTNAHVHGNVITNSYQILW
jgi:hypothetical protein